MSIDGDPGRPIQNFQTHFVLLKSFQTRLKVEALDINYQTILDIKERTSNKSTNKMKLKLPRKSV